MTVSDLIARLSDCPANARVTLLDPDKGWPLPIEIAQLPADGCNRDVNFIAITTDATSDEIADLASVELAHLHLSQIEQKMALLQRAGQSTGSAKDLLKGLSESRDSIRGFIDRTLPHASTRADKMTG
jgi:hypothetical protein